MNCLHVPLSYNTTYCAQNVYQSPYPQTNISFFSVLETVLLMRPRIVSTDQIMIFLDAGSIDSSCFNGSPAPAPALALTPLPPPKNFSLDRNYHASLLLKQYIRCFLCDHADNFSRHVCCLKSCLCHPITTACELAYCGAGGTCRKNGSGMSYHCECKEGYSNLLNMTAMPCFQNCKIIQSDRRHKRLAFPKHGLKHFIP